ncbi:transcription factor rfeH-Penicillium chrysogenum [Beauveria brongniartii RCEF 3172]|uniref:Transcription factor rfeH-Penicillium chrysogenum n=1 Tax=Beauveria brongniartii RCEF 3172 TaxID=1081107 RepID=A0A167IB25_9HYPO|nr:transcription factor rfeH-Penicillium chrysogenum [Beauveria brongniartii RCEF 3172]
MSVIAHAALEPSHRRHATSDLAAHVFATISRASSIADTRQSTVMSSRLSLKGLLQSENVQIIQKNLAVLARFADHLPRDIDAETPRVTNDELLIMGNLVRDIISSLDKIESLRADEDEDEMLPHVADKYVPTRPISSATRARRKEQNVRLFHPRRLNKLPVLMQDLEAENDTQMPQLPPHRNAPVAARPRWP